MDLVDLIVRSSRLNVPLFAYQLLATAVLGNSVDLKELAQGDYEGALPREPIPNFVNQVNEVIDVNTWSWDETTGFIKTWRGYFTDQVKSAMQKACRRGWIDQTGPEAARWALEMFWTAKSCRSNMWNRLLTISVEDVGWADPLVAFHVYQLSTLYRNDARAVVLACLMLTKASKTRLNDWAAHCYLTLVGETKAKEIFDQLGYTGLKQLFQTALVQRDLMTSILYCYLLCHTGDKTLTEGHKIIRNVLSQFLQGNAYAHTLLAWSASSNWKSAHGAVLIYLHLIFGAISDRLMTMNPVIIPNYTEYWPYMEPIVQHVFTSPPIGIPFCAVDKHTSLGKSRSKTVVDFIVEGGKLCLVDPRYEPLSNYLLWNSGLCHTNG